MKTKTLLTLTLIAFSFLCFSQGIEPFQSHKEKWGFKDKEGKIVIEPRFDNILRLKSGSGDAPFPKDFFVVNAGGRIVEIFREYIYTNSEGYDEAILSKVRESTVDGTFGIVAPDGRVVLEPVYDSIAISFKGYLDFSDDYKSFHINVSDTTDTTDPINSENLIFDHNQPIIACFKGKWGMFNYSGEQVLDCKSSRYENDLFPPGYHFYNNNVLAAIANLQGVPTFMADKDVLNNSKFNFILYRHINELEDNQIALLPYFTDAVIDTISFVEKRVLANPVDGSDYVLETRTDVLSLKSGEFYLLDATGKRIGDTTFDNIYYYSHNTIKPQDEGDFESKAKTVVYNLKVTREQVEKIEEFRIELGFPEIQGNIVFAVKGNKWWEIDINDGTIQESDVGIEEF